MAPSLRQSGDNESEVSSQSSSGDPLTMSWQKRQRVQRNKEKWARVLRGQESDDTLPTTGSTSDLDNNNDSDNGDIGTRLRKHLLRNNKPANEEKKVNERKARNSPVKKKTIKKQIFTKPEREIIRPLNKIRLGANDDSDSDSGQNPMRRGSYNNLTELSKRDDNTVSSKPDDECDEDNDPMESLRVKRLSKVRQEEEEKAREKLMASNKEELRRKEQRELAKRRNLELEMSGPVVVPTANRIQNNSESLGLRNEDNAKETTRKNVPAPKMWTPRDDGDIPPAAFPPLEPSTKQGQVAAESCTEGSSDTDERRKQKVLKQMFQDGLKRATPPKADIDVLAEISTQLDDAVSRASEKKKKIKKTSKTASHRSSKKNGTASEAELRKVLGLKKESKNDKTPPTPVTPPLTPPSPAPIKLFKDEEVLDGDGVESSWLDDLFSNVTTCCGPAKLSSTTGKQMVGPAREKRANTVSI
mmetsp:Transcript_10991/g.16167  ORF Transcript_10991/g.16167 Transcript_10991/m.16167 type:complete len:472 (+) Transcript_10991:87-1502(+)|eukprot:CAMPEP_0194231818 /NCGR_PEP_ID=MMETSP0158-20130606/414_1 /TAXON_ID=33649 /ORGANISM="Thalassionema nitzschioides, Strain L26-B" /LENGTH=471 /DNA_ID=CAMNT_0038964491 /DNA_START=40 /DNA_END=1455 /DNA_ORIENTATION=+